MAGMSVALRDQGYEIAHIPLFDLVDALGAPIGNDVAPKQARYSSMRADLRHMFANERFHQIINPIDHHAAARLLLLLCRIAAIEPRGNLLCVGLGHRQGEAAIKPNRIFA